MVVDTRSCASEEATIFDAAWTSVVDWQSGSEHIPMMIKSRIQMARYAHIDPMTWDNVEFTEFSDLYGALAELLNSENGLTTEAENR